MPDLVHFQAKLCATAAGVLIHKHKVLLVHHRKLNIWLPPGGHIEPNEFPHICAEREFYEETGVKVKVVSYGDVVKSSVSQYLPNPFAFNLHWISQANYNKRLKSKHPTKRTTSQTWPKGCEQHYTFVYLVKLLDGHPNLHQNHKETKGIDWFSQDQFQKLQTTPDVKNELILAFKLIKKSLSS